MSEHIDWLDDGTAGGSPYSPRFGDRYRGEFGGLGQSREVFLKGCGLPAAWAGQPHWRILETGFGLGQNFLVTWQAWRDDPARPQLLHFVSTEAFPASAEDLLRGAASHPELLPLAEELARQYWGLLPGFHRIVLDQGRVLLTLCIGDAKHMLRQQRFEADSVYLDGFSPQKNPGIWDIHTFKAVARCCRRGTRIATWTIARAVRDALAEAGFVVHKTPGIPPKRDNLQGEYNPAWQPKRSGPPVASLAASSCMVIGAGLAGAAAAASLARRGWQVVVLDAAATPAAGASGLPAGLLAPHVSPDDSLLSQLTRSGVRLTRQQAGALLDADDCGRPGMLEHRTDGKRQLPPAWATDSMASDWSRAASATELQAAGLPADAAALWHGQGGWIRPAALVEAWLATPGIRWQGGAEVARLEPGPAGWQALDASGRLLAAAALVVLAAGHASRALSLPWRAAAGGLALQPIRGQLSWGWVDGATALPPFPVNGHGSLIPAVPLDGRSAWIAGASFERDVEQPLVRAQDHAHNLERLQTLLPRAAAGLAGSFDAGAQAWAGVRCATPQRLPALGRLDSDNKADTGTGQVWVSSGMGSRGLSFAALCGEILAAQLHGEPLPVEERLVAALRPA